jgi:hypothetical protein
MKWAIVYQENGMNIGNFYYLLAIFDQGNEHVI